MDRWLYACRTVSGSPQDIERVLTGDLDALLVVTTSQDSVDPGASIDPSEVSRRGDGTVTARLSAPLLSRLVTKAVRLHFGVAYSRLGSMRIPVHWAADSLSRLFPTFDGYLELERVSPSEGRLMLTGHYRPPFGAVGAIADTLGLKAVAVDSVTGFLDRLVVAVEAGLAQFSPPDADPIAPPEPTVAAGPGSTDSGGHGVLRVRDVMTPDPVVFEPDMPLQTAARRLLQRHISGAPVVRRGELIGVLSEADLLLKEVPRTPNRDDAVRRRQQALTVGQACTRPAQTTHPDVLLRDAAATMFERAVSRLVVVAGGSIVGILTRHDMLRALARADATLEALATATLATGVHGLTWDIGEGSTAIPATAARG